MKQNYLHFIKTHTKLCSVSLVPEIKLYAASDITGLWHMTETDLKQKNINPPFWAFAWPGGQAIARYILDNPSLVKNKSVLDLASGSGIAGIAAIKASAKHVDFNEIDPVACKSIHLNCAANGLKVCPSILEKNLILDPTHDYSQKNSWEIIVAGDVFYEQPMSQKIFKWLLNRAREGTEVLIGDPGRCYFPEKPIEMLYQYSVKTLKMIENEDEIVTRVYRLLHDFG